MNINIRRLNETKISISDKERRTKIKYIRVIFKSHLLIGTLWDIHNIPLETNNCDLNINWEDFGITNQEKHLIVACELVQAKLKELGKELVYTDERIIECIDNLILETTEYYNHKINHKYKVKPITKSSNW